jgi:uncharacterized MAPEG superfamily protein
MWFGERASRRPQTAACLMTIELKMLSVSIVLGLVQIVLVSHSASMQCGYRWTTGPREALSSRDAYGTASQLDGSLLADNNRKEEHCFS